MEIQAFDNLLGLINAAKNPNNIRSIVEVGGERFLFVVKLISWSRSNKFSATIFETPFGLLSFKKVERNLTMMFHNIFIVII